MDQKSPPLKLNENLFHVFPLHQYKSAVGVPHRTFSDAQCSFLTFEGDPILSSTLLFQAAVTLCAHGKRVLYLDSRPLSRLPPPVTDMPTPTLSSMSSAQFTYLPTDVAVRQHLSAAHLWPSPRPDALLVDATRLPLSTGSTANTGNTGNPVFGRLWCLEAALRETAHFLSLTQDAPVLGLMALPGSMTSDNLDRDVTVMTSLCRHRIDRLAVVGVSRYDDGRALLQSRIQPDSSCDSSSAGVIQLELSLHDSCVKLERFQLLKT